MSTSVCHLLNIFRNLSRLSSYGKAVQRWPLCRHVARFSTVSLGIAKCEGMLVSEQEKAEGFTHEQCIKQACVQSVNSATTLLTTTAFAVLDVCKKYKDSLARLLALLEESILVDGGDYPELWDTIVAARLDVNRTKAALSELNTYMESVEKVVNSTTEAAFLAGAEYMCTVLCERLYSVQREISLNILEIRKLEEDYLKLQQQVVKNSKSNDTGAAETPKSEHIEVKVSKIIDENEQKL